MAVDERYYEVLKPGSFSERLMIRARDRIYVDFLATCSPGPAETVLDVGVSDVLNDGANVLERLYPNQEQITACGLGEATEFQAAFPRVRYRQIAPGEPLPFANKSFDVATSNAVLEHIGSRENQARFIAEMMRVARRVFISVPNRFFPVEHHTAIPLAHWSDKMWLLACTITGKQKWAQDKELILMSARHLSSLVPSGSPYRVGYTGLLLGPFSSNLFLAIT
jgi:methyltransferase family protein